MHNAQCTGHRAPGSVHQRKGGALATAAPAVVSANTLKSEASLLLGQLYPIPAGAGK